MRHLLVLNNVIPDEWDFAQIIDLNITEEAGWTLYRKGQIYHAPGQGYLVVIATWHREGEGEDKTPRPDAPLFSRDYWTENARLGVYATLEEAQASIEQWVLTD